MLNKQKKKKTFLTFRTVNHQFIIISTHFILYTNAPKYAPIHNNISTTIYYRSIVIQSQLLQESYKLYLSRKNI